jgi:hypothetical protein
MKVVVTGAAGMVGSNLVHGLNAVGIDDVIAVDDLTDGQKYRNLAGAQISDYFDKSEFYDRFARGEFGHVGRGSGPTRVGVALPGADAAAGGVEEDAVEFGLGGEAGGAVPEGGAVVEKFGAGGAAFEGVDALFVAVGGPDDAFVHHEIGEVEGFAAFTGAGVPPRFAGLGGGGDADELGGEILDLEFAGLKLFGFEKIGDAREAHGVGRARGGFGGEERFGEAGGAAGAGAEPEGWVALELAQVIGGDIHLRF